jgi:hypothetical protein
MSKECGSCSKCCEGFLTGSVFGNIFGNGKPCVFVDKQKQCSIHEIRPKNPCRDYKCMWLRFEDVPLWMKPNSSNVLVSVEKYKDREFLILNCYDNDYSARYLSYVITYAKKNNMPLMYQLAPETLVIYNDPLFFTDMFKNSEVFYWAYFYMTHELEKANGFIKYLPITIK